MSQESPNPEEVSFATRIGAVPKVADSCITVYVPNKDQHNKEFGTQRSWVLGLIRLFSDINGGATAFPVEGGWLAEDGSIILENPVVVYSFITDPDHFESKLPEPCCCVFVYH